jgi:hypothetical protein
MSHCSKRSAMPISGPHAIPSPLLLISCQCSSRHPGAKWQELVDAANISTAVPEDGEPLVTPMAAPGAEVKATGDQLTAFKL